jgi:type 1 glutamine amidotransferase
MAHCIVVISDGRDGTVCGEEASHLASNQRIQQIKQAMARGTGLVPIHFATFAAEKDLETVKEWQGACFQWERNNKRDWLSKITWAKGMLDFATTNHEILNGVDGPALHEEYYHNLSFHPLAVPLIKIRALPGETDLEKTVAWAIEREDGGRGFGTTMAHSLDSLRHAGLRTLLLNGISWAAGIKIPSEGLKVSFAEREVVNKALNNIIRKDTITVTVLAGNAAHRWHNWPETTGALLRAWGDDARITTKVFTDPKDLPDGLKNCEVLVLNWCNWDDPIGFTETTRSSIQNFVANGGGVFIHHFANGACHASLPRAGASDWPWYRTLVRRVWEHRDISPGVSKHDKFRSFEVKSCSTHPLVAGMPNCTIEDELYWRQHGTEPIEVLLKAKSEETGADEPLLWAYEIGQARIVQSLLGHSAATYSPAPMRALMRRIIAWCAKREIHGSIGG